MAVASLLAQKARDSRGLTSEEDRVNAVKRALDERLEQRLSHSIAATQFKTDIQEVIDRGALGSSEITALNCAETLCKVFVENSSKSELESSVVSLSRSLGKTSGALIVFNGDSGEKHVYIGKSDDDIAVSLPGDPEEAETVVIRKEDGDRQAPVNFDD